MISALIPDSVYAITKKELAKQYDDQIVWVPALTDGNGDPATDRFGNRLYGDPVTLSARVVPTNQAFYNAQGQQLVVTQKIYVDPGTGIRPGDKVLPGGTDPSSIAAQRFPPILAIERVPTHGMTVYDRVLTGAAT